MLGKILRRHIKHGRLTIIRPDGHTEQFGELTAAKPRPDVAVRLKGALNASTIREIEAAFADLVRNRAEALFVAGDTFFVSRRVQFATLAARYTLLKLSLHPDLYFGELYVDGALTMERGTLWDLLELLGRNQLEQRSVRGMVNPANVQTAEATLRDMPEAARALSLQ
jgi:hypothetical protein